MPQIWGFSALTYDHSPNIFFFHTLKHAYTHIHMITSEYQQDILMKVSNMHVIWMDFMGSDIFSQIH